MAASDAEIMVGETAKGVAGGGVLGALGGAATGAAIGAVGALISPIGLGAMAIAGLIGGILPGAATFLGGVATVAPWIAGAGGVLGAAAGVGVGAGIGAGLFGGLGLFKGKDKVAARTHEHELLKEKIKGTRENEILNAQEAAIRTFGTGLYLKGAAEKEAEIEQKIALAVEMEHNNAHANHAEKKFVGRCCGAEPRTHQDMVNSVLGGTELGGR